MSKTFNLFDVNKTTNDWDSISEAYTPTVIDKIKSPDGDLTTKAPTSIPSPFARMDLVNSAFQSVNLSGDLEGNTIFHQLVSDSLDVAEMFFNIDQIGAALEIRTWNKKTGLEKLKQSENTKIQLLGQTLELYLNQDAEYNNFNSMDCIHILYYKHQIIGGTSPRTLFFSSANDLSFTQISFGNDTLFDQYLNPLCNRSEDFIRYYFMLFMTYNHLKEKMPALWSYLTLTLDYLKNHNPALYDEIQSYPKEINSSSYSNDLLHQKFDPIENGLLFMQIPLMKIKSQNLKKTVINHSQFLLQSSKKTNPVLVLQNKLPDAVKLLYIDNKTYWDPTWEIPFSDTKPLEERILPHQSIQFPYLTVSDFLEPCLIELPYEMNSHYFYNYDRNLNQDKKEKSYLLPLTKRFFDYFTSQDVMKGKDGEPMISIQSLPNSVEVKLFLPINGFKMNKYITFTRSYIRGKNRANIQKNEGYIGEHKIATVIAPFVRLEKPFYRVALLDRDNKNSLIDIQYQLKFWANDNHPVVTEYRHRSSKSQDTTNTDYYVVQENFDYLSIQTTPENRGVLIPKFIDGLKTKGTKKFHFAVDFGTTNTHIEYREDLKQTHPFDITEQDLQYQKLYVNKNSETPDLTLLNFEKRLLEEFYPQVITSNSEYQFPIRTVTLEHQSFKFERNPIALADINIPFIYEKDNINRNSKVTTNLKWSDFQNTDSHNRRRVECYIENLMLLMRNKVICNNGELESTTMTWFYPASMSPIKLTQLSNIWDKYYQKYFQTTEKSIKIPESIAPFYFYKHTLGIAAYTQPAVSIDIGGGTTDVVIFQAEKPIAQTSMKFAANNIFGDIPGSTSTTNGFINKYYQRFVDSLGNSENNEFDELVNTASSISEQNNSSDIVSFLFSLEKNEEIKNNRDDLKLNHCLSTDKDMKIVFLTFFSAIIYHIARLMKAKGMSNPKHLLFSGTGAKILIITNGGTKDFNAIQTLSSLIFQKVYQLEKAPEICIHLAELAKEITCKGGIYYDSSITTQDMSRLKATLIGNNTQDFAENTHITYSDVTASYLHGVKLEYESFINLLTEINTEFDFNDNFDINTSYLREYCKILRTEEEENISKGFETKKKEMDNLEKVLDESLFFYPLTYGLNKLAYICSQNK